MNEPIINAEGSSHVNIVRIEFGKEIMALMIGMALVIAGAGIIMGLNLARQQELQYHFDYLDRQYRMVELKLDDWTVVAHRAGIVLPSDYARGPEGNPDSKSFHIKPKGK